MIWKGRRIVVSNAIMIRRGLINVKFLPWKGKANEVASWLIIVEVLLRDTISEVV